ncbi:MAG: hypothetical protein HND46_20975 [Chloroflexi bacterium]|nr:hypothetical protein [Chloroflexota bacterium]NOG65898.1 hypothetical protein [Chloroflexota bacterium]
MSTYAPNLEEVVSQALKLTPEDQAQLVTRIVNAMSRGLTVTPTHESVSEHWGQALNQLLDTLDTSDWEALEMDDPVEWVRQQILR